MTKQIKINRIGNSAGTTIPKEMLDRHNLSVGDTAFLIDTPNGILIAPYDPNFEEAMRSYEKMSKKYRDTLRRLAQ